METQGQRLKAVMKHFRHTQESIGQSLGVSKGFVSRMINNKAPLSIKIIDGLAKSFQTVNINWLLTGEGEMFLWKNMPVPDGTLAPVVLEPEVGYGKGEGRLEYLERMVRELEERVRALEAGKGE